MRVFVGPLNCPPPSAAFIARPVTGRPERGLRVSLGVVLAESPAPRACRLLNRMERSSGRRCSSLREAMMIRRGSSFLEAIKLANFELSFVSFVLAAAFSAPAVSLFSGADFLVAGFLVAGFLVAVFINRTPQQTRRGTYRTSPWQSKVRTL